METSKETASWLSRCQNPSPSPHLPQPIAQPAPGFLPWHGLDPCSQPRCTTLIGHAAQGGCCVLFVCADSAVSVSRHCACCPSTIQKRTLDPPLTVLFSFYSFFFFCYTFSKRAKCALFISKSLMGRGWGGPSCCSAFPFLFLFLRLIGVRQGLLEHFSQHFTGWGHFLIIGNQTEM